MTLLIRRAVPGDAAAVTRHMAEPAVFGGLLQLPYPSPDAWLKRLTEGSTPQGADLALVAELDGDVCGLAGLNSPGPHVRRRHVMSLGISVSPASQGQGVGTALMTALCDYADRWTGALRLELSVYTDNAVAIRLYRNFGFEIEGTMRAYALRDGVYCDAHAMARLHPNAPVLDRDQG